MSYRSPVRIQSSEALSVVAAHMAIAEETGRSELGRPDNGLVRALGVASAVFADPDMVVDRTGQSVAQANLEAEAGMAAAIWRNFRVHR